MNQSEAFSQVFPVYQSTSVSLLSAVTPLGRGFQSSDAQERPPDPLRKECSVSAILFHIKRPQRLSKIILI